MTADMAPAWFFDEAGNRLGVLANERARQQWYADRDLPDPVAVETKLRLDRLHEND
jgi:hypothetical protein